LKVLDSLLNSNSDKINESDPNKKSNEVGALISVDVGWFIDPCL